MDRRLRQEVWRRAAHRCEYCRFPAAFTRVPFQIDHIVPEKHRGATVEANLALSCFYCNTYKGPNLAGLDPVTARLTRLFHPRTDRWEEHFRRNGPRLDGLTDVGRATLEVLRMNHPDALAVREALWREGIL